MERLLNKKLFHGDARCLTVLTVSNGIGDQNVNPVWGYLHFLLCHSVWEKDQFKFKSVKLRFKIDSVLHPTCVKMLDYGISKVIYVFCYLTPFWVILFLSHGILLV